MTFIEIEENTYNALSTIAQREGVGTVEKLLTMVAKNFSTGCSVTLQDETPILKKS